MKLNLEKLRNDIFSIYENYFPSNSKNLFFIDKSLENFNIDNFKIFPNAKFIHSNRNYEDTAIAIYQSMLPELPLTHSIPDILAYIDNNIKIMNYLKKNIQKILTIDLENLTEKKEEYTKKIFSFVD